MISGECSVSEKRAGGSIEPDDARAEEPWPGRPTAARPAASDAWRRAAGASWIVAVAFTGLVVAREANAEFIVQRIQDRLESGGPATPFAGPCLAPCPARAREAMAAEEVRAYRESENRPAAGLSRAEADIRHALARSPLLAASWSRLAQIQSYASPDPGPALATLAISYQAAPYDPTGAAFRVDYVLSHWAAAPRPLRRKALDESIWLASVKPDVLDQLRAKPHDPAADYALELAISQADESM
jgi:hypothetical protein